MFQYQIADLVLEVDCDDPALVRLMNNYLLDQTQKPDLRLSLQAVEAIVPPVGKIISEDSIKWLSKSTGENGYYLYNIERNFGKILTLADINVKWSKGTFQYLDSRDQRDEVSYKTQTEAYTYILMGIMFRYCLINYGGIVIHSSTLVCEGKGIMFSAPSGTGKSTHVKLWKKYIGEGTNVLNDDTPAVRPRKGKLHVFGTPWSGSSHINSNCSAPLEAIVLLEQSDTNYVRQLSAQEAILKLMPRTFLPYFDKAMMDMAFDIVDDILSCVPVYLLRCRPDKESVELIYKCVMS